MKCQIIGLHVASVIFGVACLFHLARLLANAPLQVGSHHIGTGLTLLMILVTAVLSAWMEWLARHPSAVPPAHPAA